jgi:hypothetical protein
VPLNTIIQRRKAEIMKCSPQEIKAFAGVIPYKMCLLLPGNLRHQNASANKSACDHVVIAFRFNADLQLKTVPRLIECLTIHNIQGAYPVAAMSVFKDAESHSNRALAF